MSFTDYGIVLFVSASAFVECLQQSSSQAMEVTTCDISLFSHHMEDQELSSLYEKLQGTEGVSDSLYQAVMTYFCQAKMTQMSENGCSSLAPMTQEDTICIPVDIQFLDDASYQKLLTGLELPVQEFTGQDAKGLAVAKLSNSQASVTGVEQLDSVFRDSTETLTLQPGREDVPDEKKIQMEIVFADTVPPDTPPYVRTEESQECYFHLLLPYSRKSQFETPEKQSEVKGISFQSEESETTMKKMQAVLEKTTVTADYQLLNLHALMDENRNYIFIIRVFANTFIILISLIAAANVFNTVSTSIRLRKRELSMLRSVGMSERDFQRMMNYESIFFGCRSLLVGLPVSLLMSFLIYRGMFAGGADNLVFRVPWKSMGISMISVLFIVFASMLYAAGQVKNANIIDALREETE